VGRVAHAREKNRGEERGLAVVDEDGRSRDSPELLESRKKRSATMGARAPPLAPSCLASASGHWSTGSAPGVVVPSTGKIHPWRRRARPRRALFLANREKVLGASSGAGPTIAVRAPTPSAEEARGATRRKPGAMHVRALAEEAWGSPAASRQRAAARSRGGVMASREVAWKETKGIRREK
jgi:hypothetical protein